MNVNVVLIAMAASPMNLFWNKDKTQKKLLHTLEKAFI